MSYAMPRRCPVCGKVYYFKGTITIHHFHRCSSCDTEYPIKMMPAVPSTTHVSHGPINKDDINQVKALLQEPKAFWEYLNQHHIID